MRRFEKRANELLSNVGMPGSGNAGLQPTLEGLPTGELVAILAGIVGDGDERRYLRNVVATAVLNRLGAQDSLLDEILAPPGENDPERFASALARSLRADVASIDEVGGARFALQGRHGVPRAMAEAEGDHAPTNPLRDEVLRTGKPFAVADLAADPRWAESAAWRRFGLRSYAAAPAMDTDGDVNGVVWVGSFRPRVYSAEEMVLLERVALRVARDALHTESPVAMLGPVFAAPPAAVERIFPEATHGTGRIVRLRPR